MQVRFLIVSHTIYRDLVRANWQLRVALSFFINGSWWRHSFPKHLHYCSVACTGYQGELGNNWRDRMKMLIENYTRYNTQTYPMTMEGQAAVLKRDNAVVERNLLPFVTLRQLCSGSSRHVAFWLYISSSWECNAYVFRAEFSTVRILPICQCFWPRLRPNHNNQSNS
jgi:hypothetical protein